MLFLGLLMRANASNSPCANTDVNGNYPDKNGLYPDSNGKYPNNNGQYPDASGRYPNESGQYPDANGNYPPNDTPHGIKCLYQSILINFIENYARLHQSNQVLMNPVQEMLSLIFPILMDCMLMQKENNFPMQMGDIQLIMGSIQIPMAIIEMLYPDIYGKKYPDIYGNYPA